MRLWSGSRTYTEVMGPMAPVLSHGPSSTGMSHSCTHYHTVSQKSDCNVLPAAQGTSGQLISLNSKCISLSLSLSVCVCLCVCLSVCLAIRHSVSLFFSVHISVYMCVRIRVCCQGKPEGMKQYHSNFACVKYFVRNSQKDLLCRHLLKNIYNKKYIEYVADIRCVGQFVKGLSNPNNVL